MSAALEDILAGIPGALGIAVSGGLDSLTLMAVAARVRPETVTAVHAVSPAVPPQATERVRAIAADRNWPLRVVEPGEFADPDYLANPVNRCFFCKNNLFITMTRAMPEAVLATGTNLDDLGDFRPGLDAARDHGVRAPFVEAKIGKDAIRAIARAEGLPEVAALPAQPCLASRIETGIPVRAEDLAFVNRIEMLVTAHLGAGDHRCRVTARGIVVQTAEPSAIGPALADRIAGVCAGDNRAFAGVEAYRKGSAFLRLPEPGTP